MFFHTVSECETLLLDSLYLMVAVLDWRANASSPFTWCECLILRLGVLCSYVAFLQIRKKRREQNMHLHCARILLIQTLHSFFFKFADKSGVLIVKILEMFEECMIQVAICQQLEESPAIVSSRDLVIHTREPILKVLFARETAAHLKSRPQDVIHIYPPW